MQKGFWIAFTIALSLLAGCQLVIQPPSMESSTISLSQAETTTAVTATTTVTQSPAPTETTSIPAPAAVTATTAMTEEASTPISQAPGTTEEAATPTLTVIISSLRIRSGPGTGYAILGVGLQGEPFPIIGQAYDCQWYQIVHPQLGEVWMSGGAQYVTTNTDCAQVAEAAIPPLPTPGPAAVATPAPATSDQTVPPTPQPTQAEQTAADPFPADKGCMLLQNQLGPELTFTFTSEDGRWTETVKVYSDADLPYCLPPGHYRVTVDAPPPWADINLDINLHAGDRTYFPIRPRD
ncbi:MAG: SH3 domain-containing protein [Caldilineaceae bacterium]